MRAAEPVEFELVDERVAVTAPADARPEWVIRVRVAPHGVELDNSGKTVRELRRGS